MVASGWVAGDGSCSMGIWFQCCKMKEVYSTLACTEIVCIAILMLTLLNFICKNCSDGKLYVTFLTTVYKYIYSK